MKIYKYELPDTPGYFEIKAPAFSEILSVGIQGAAIVAWIKVDMGSSPSTHRIYIAFTGDLMPDDIGRFIGTVQKEGLVFHVFAAPFF